MVSDIPTVIEENKSLRALNTVPPYRRQNTKLADRDCIIQTGRVEVLIIDEVFLTELYREAAEHANVEES
ncbi:unnamed protein product [Ceutorhynchus assimilis]|uniref:Uncharacterized protein n=1 Tax=Ceutorhynchus assimilis TaxID=467358 RepID=A0A9N9MPW0_9CUCU|nr:unnamed protein product [Ceutorhynchus assimilis]